MWSFLLLVGNKIAESIGQFIQLVHLYKAETKQQCNSLPFHQQLKSASPARLLDSVSLPLRAGSQGAD